jgi:hypothetical protein
MNWIQKNNNTNIKVKYNKRPKTQDNKNSNKSGARTDVSYRLSSPAPLIATCHGL